MAHITHVKIYGLLGRKKPISFDLQRDVNVIFGDNGGGKTTVLKILDAALSLNGTTMLALPVQKAEVDIYSVEHKQVIKHVWDRKSAAASRQSEAMAEWIETFPSGEFPHQFLRSVDAEWTLSPMLKLKKGGWKHTFLPTTRLYLSNTYKVSSGKPLTEAELDSLFFENVNKSWLRYYSNVLARVRAIQEEGLRTVANYALAPKIEEKTGPKLDPLVAYDRVKKFWKRQSAAEIALGTKASFVKRYETEENFRLIVDSLNRLEEAIEKAMVPATLFMQKISNLFSAGKKIALNNSNELQLQLQDGSPLSLAALSSGEKHLIAILLAAMSAGQSSIIIDEPELSMHIDWQRQFVETIRDLNPECQLIVASHSPEVMAEIADEKIVSI
ncbi:AAA family ATPase [Massilia sp. 2TAF26]|uniref:AAA family ATPase n=1 Tax=Massilia sp. 2TAF26 TaxID=3233012 RepID=UPI003F997680